MDETGDDPTPQTALVSIVGPAEVTEGNTTTDYTVSVDQTPTSTLTVNFTYSGVAIDGTDFTGVGSVTIAAGSTSTTFKIATIDDNLAEGSEIYTVTISSVTGGGFELVSANPAANHVDTTILDNDFAPVGTPDMRNVVEGRTTTAIASVLSNDTDANNDPLSVSVFSLTASGTGVVANGTNSLTLANFGTVTMNADGTFSFAAAVRDNETKTVADTDGPDVFTFYYKATDGTNLSSWIKVDVNITDTTPVAVLDVVKLPAPATPGASAIVNGNVLLNDIESADTPIKVTSVNGVAVSATGTTTVQGTFGNLVIKANGDYTYTQKSVSVTSDGNVNTKPDGVTMYATTNWSAMQGNTISTGSLTAWAGVTEIGGSKPGFGVKFQSGPQVIDNNEALIVTLDYSANFVRVQLGQINANQGALSEAHWYAYDEAGKLISSGNFTSAANNGVLQPLDISNTTEIKYLVFANEGGHSSQGFNVTNITFQPSGVENFTYTITDKDGSTDTTSLLITPDQLVKGTDGNDTALAGGAGDDILYGLAGNDILNGGAGDDYLIGGLGNDTLTGGPGKDTFFWQAGDAATAATDTITDFVKGVGGDVLNLADLLQGETAANIGSGGFLTSATYTGGNTTLVFDTNGSAAGGDTQTIVIQGVDLTAGNTLSTSQVLNNLLHDGNLKVDS